MSTEAGVYARHEAEQVERTSQPTRGNSATRHRLHRSADRQHEAEQVERTSQPTRGNSATRHQLHRSADRQHE